MAGSAAPGPTRIPLLPGRECGTCDVCCVALTIPALRKPQGIRCHNLAPGTGCTIYPDRPGACRTFDCAWRQFTWVADTLRPDRSGILLRLRLPRSRTDGTALIVTILREDGLAAPGLAEAVAAAVVGGLAVLIEVPGHPGYTSGTARIDGVLRDAVAARDRPGLLAILRQCWQMGQDGPRERIAFD